MKTLKELFERLLEPTPAFFATLRKLAATIVLISGLVIGIEKAGYQVPHFITSALNFYTASSGLLAVFITSLTSIWRFQALNSATSSLMIFGQSCVAIGDRALYSCTSGSQNIAIGSSALNSNTTGYQNIAIGINTLSQNMIGYNNVALGNNTLVYNTGDYNIALGNSALSRNTTGYYNIALGVQSGSIISGTGDINTGTGATNDTSVIGGTYTDGVLQSTPIEIRVYN